MEDVDLEKRLELIKEHFDLELKEKGEYTGIREFRKHISYYTKGLPDSSVFRGKINFLENKDEVITELDRYFNSIKGENYV